MLLFLKTWEGKDSHKAACKSVSSLQFLSYFRISLLSCSSRFIAPCSSRSDQFSNSDPSSRGSQSVQEEEGSVENENLHSIVGSPRIPSFVSPVVNLSLGDQAFFLLAFIACMGTPMSSL